jgi:hypothetical protein
VGAGVFTRVIANSNYNFNLPEHSRSNTVRPADGARKFELILADLVDEAQPWRHDPSKLASQVMKCYEENKKPH